MRGFAAGFISWWRRVLVGTMISGVGMVGGDGGGEVSLVSLVSLVRCVARLS